MKFKRVLRRAAGITAVAAGFLALNLPAQASATTAGAAVTCSFQTRNTGNYLTAVGGGGRVTDVIHTDATQRLAWEKFTLVQVNDGSPVTRYGIRTVTGNYLTAVGGGGRITDVIHSNAVNLLAWEKFALVPVGNGFHAIQTINGRFLTAVGGGGRTTDTIHSDATVAQSWEMFRVFCSI
ncbi:hypothetical protein AB0K48_33310 [Nonomuraea sp. NPDC055795]